MYLNNFLSQNQNNRWGFFCILLYGLLVGFQGFDLCDEGWTMTAYQQIFICPQSVEYNFLCYSFGWRFVGKTFWLGRIFVFSSFNGFGDIMYILFY